MKLLDILVAFVARTCMKYMDWKHKRGREKPALPNVNSFDMNVSNERASAMMTFDDCPGLQALVIESTKMLTEFERAENFLELDLNSKCEMHNPIRLTIQWADKKGPGRLVAELKDEISGLKEDLAEVLECAEEWARHYGPWDNGNPDHIAGGAPEDNLYNALVRWARDGRPGLKGKTNGQ
jgi:hypothetical protein